MKRTLCLALCLLGFATHASYVTNGGLNGVRVSGTPASSNLCLVSSGTTGASWGSCASGSGIAGTWGATTGNIVTTNGANTAQDSGTALTSLAPKDSPAFTTLAAFSFATASTIPYLDASKHLVSSAVTPTELGYVSGVTSAIQTQLNAKQASTGDIQRGNCYVSPKAQALGNSGASLTIDLSTGNKFTVTLNSATPAITFSNPTDGCSYWFAFTQDATGNRVPSFAGTTVIWGGSGAHTFSTTASAKDAFNCVYDSVATSLYCNLVTAYQ